MGRYNRGYTIRIGRDGKKRVFESAEDAETFVYLDNLRAGGVGGGLFTASATATNELGNIPVGYEVNEGDSISDFLIEAISAYQQTGVSIQGWDNGVYEHGRTFSEDTFNLNFTFYNNLNIAQLGTATFSDTYIANQTITDIPTTDGGDVSLSVSGQLLVDNSDPSGTGALQRTNAAQLAITGFENTNGDPVTATISSTVRFRYWIIDSADRVDYTDGDIDDAIGQALITDNASVAGGGLVSGLMANNESLTHDFVAESTGYIYYIYPAAATLNEITNPGGNVLYDGDETGDTSKAVFYIGQFMMTNQYGMNVEMKVLRSKNASAFGTGVYNVI